jgi:hypothetical protein
MSHESDRHAITGTEGEDGPRPLDPLEGEGEEGARGKRLPLLVCRKLRTKTAFGSMQPGAPDWRTGDATTAVYWCLKTMETAGIDGGYAHPHACGAGRECFEGPIA